MFPEQEISYNTTIENENKTTNNGKSFLFDFEAGDFIVKDGKVQIVSNKEALQIWIQKVLKTTKNKFKIYDSIDYGITNLKNLITSNFPYSFIKAEIQKSVTDTLLTNSNINSVTGFEFTRDGTKLTVSFTVNSSYGNTESEVII